MLKINTRLLFLFFFSCILLCFSSCIKKAPINRITQVLLVPLSPNSLASDFSIDGILYANTIGYSTTVGTVRYTLPYYTVTPKNTVISYNFNGLPGSIASVTKDLEEDKAYSTFLIDSVHKAKVVLVTDDLTEPTPGKVKIRFFHFSPNTVSLDVVISGQTNKLFSGRSFNDQASTSTHENFIEIDAGTYTFLFNNSATGATLYTTSSQVLLPDRIYTIAARGFTGGATNLALGAWVYPNKP